MMLFLKNEAMSFFCCKCFRPKKNKIGIAKALADTSKLARLVQIESTHHQLTDYDKHHLKNSTLPIIWVLGGPGSGKGTQCAKVVEKFGFTHISSGDLLREEVRSGSSRGQKIEELMKRGELVPVQIVLELITEAMIAHLDKSEGFLIDGYPRNVNQALEFEKEISPCSKIVFFDVSDDIMTERLLKRSKTSGRSDDNEETIKLRLKTFHNQSKPVIEIYKDKCEIICANRSENDIFEDVIKILQH